MAKPRVLITTDIGGSDPDDKQSMAHALVYADEFELEGIVSSPTKHGGRTKDIYQAIDAYAKDYGNLKTYSDAYPTPDYLRSITKQGSINPQPSKGWSSSTEGSKAIINAAHSGDGPLYVLAWGAMTDVAQALHDDPSITSKIRVYSLGSWNTQQDKAARDYVYNNFKDLWWIESDWTMRGIYADKNGSEKNSFNMNEMKGHGALGDYFYNARPWGLKMGDTPSLLYVLDDFPDNNPTAGGWGGRFEKTSHGPNYWRDLHDSKYASGGFLGAETIRTYQQAIYNDFYKKMDRALKPNPNGSGNTDDPVTAKADSATTKANKPIEIAVLQNDGAPDGGLKIASADSKSAKGGTIKVNADGTVTYTPKSDYVGNDSFSYTAKDTDGDTAKATVTVTVAPASSGENPSQPQPPSQPPVTGNFGDTQPASKNGTKPVDAKDDYYPLDAGKTIYFNTKYATWNDVGKDGGLKVIAVASESTEGAEITWRSDGTTIYTPKAGFAGIDRIQYMVQDRDGDTDTAFVKIEVKGSGGTTPTPPPATNPNPGSSNPKPPQGNDGSVAAVDDFHFTGVSEKHYIADRWLLVNDLGQDNGLKIDSIESTSEKGGKISWSNKTTVYTPKAGFSGKDSFEYTVVDADGNTDTGYIFVEVNNQYLYT